MGPHEGREIRFGVVIERSKNGSDRRQAFVTMRCERSGTYQPQIRKLKRDDTGSRKYECPFKLCGYHIANVTWKFNVISSIHNHALTEKLVGHPIVCHLFSEEKVLISKITLYMMAPKNIFASLKQKIPLNVSNIKQIYNVCMVCEDKVIVQDIFWSHPDSIKLFNIFPIMLIIDSTYETNEYRLPILEIVGVTSMEMPFSVDFAFLESEKEDNVTWALEMCKTMLKDQENLSQVIITDCDTTLMNLVATVFPTLSALLCKYHITKNVRSRVKHVVAPNKSNMKMGKWSNLMWLWKM
ncbi:protein FAR1-RELATED SEQUENCE 5-like [Lathyrus oleraceus]|uniref:protein FAR1-RELATED SEQUENCE 5-like n=1 Tax=Pisum sativum TaxID=3888 RepID=UPI0021D1E979|nr:protein FAR1-RELATED SEQUENCE 5-like [Pisum sativum]